MAEMFGEMGISLRTVFPDPEDNLKLYGNHTWKVVRKQPYHIIHAVPTIDNVESSFWEEWYTVNGGPVVHHILFSEKPPIPYHDIYEPPKKRDGLHPAEIYGRNWYVVEHPALRAWAVEALFLKK